MASRKLFDGGEISLMSEILRLTVPLPGARCVELPAAFDPAGHREPAVDVAYRHRAAAQLCEACPALGPCRQWADSMRADGMVRAGRMPAQMVGRPSTRTKAS